MLSHGIVIGLRKIASGGVRRLNRIIVRYYTKLLILFNRLHTKGSDDVPGTSG